MGGAASAGDAADSDDDIVDAEVVDEGTDGADESSKA
jgi:hypothetical protein